MVSPVKADDELARTATADPSSPALPIAGVGATLGRYRIERELGVGGMGVVHAAFDPDLERRVALKVLRSAASGDEARLRLLREARAMARLAHPNVVVVHEVGSAGGRDYVAMELVDGGTVDEWLKAARRDPAAVFEVFAHAGRGLAAAHAAGLVHRDFKPHNVLRGRDGRVVVTDFGLARGVEAPPDPLAETREAAPALDARETPGSMSGLTRTGSVLGTPAYMAPEQWRGVVGPASDQFAYCVALWEALAGERPFRAETAAALRAQVERGLAPEELVKLPRRVRAALARGLDPDPQKRWPTMDALLARLEGDATASRGRLPIVAVGAAAAALVAVGFALTRGESAVVVAPAFACAPPALSPSAVWPASATSALTSAGQGPAATQLAADFARWTTARDQACAQGPLGAERRVCLDAVLARFDAIAQGVTAAGAAHLEHVDPGELLVDPDVCAVTPSPRLLPPSPPGREVIARWLAEHARTGPADSAALLALGERVASDPCASALAVRLAADAEESTAKHRPLVERAAADAERCTDERVRADVALAQATDVVSSELLDVTLRPKLQHAEAAVARVPQADLTARLESMRSRFAARNDEPDAAIAHLDAAATGFAARGRSAAELRASAEAARARTVRGQAADLAATVPRLTALRARAVAALGESDPLVRGIDRNLAMEMFSDGDVVAAHARLDAVRGPPQPQKHPRRVTGRVVDARGAPVAGAVVTSGSMLRGDAVGAVMAWPIAADQRTATTDAAGEFMFADAAGDGGVVASAGALRSWGAPIADRVTLTVLPTSRVAGRIELHGVPAHDVFIAVADRTRPVFRAYMLVSPVDAKGGFALDNVPRGEVEITAVGVTATGATTGAVRAVIDRPVVGGVALAIPVSSRKVDVLVRSTVAGGPGNAEILMVAGKLPATLTAAELTRMLGIQAMRFARVIEGEHAPPAVLVLAHPGDLFATLTDVGPGDESACAIALPNDMDEELQHKTDRSYDKLMFRCVPIPPDAKVVTVEVAPWPRLD